MEERTSKIAKKKICMMCLGYLALFLVILITVCCSPLRKSLDDKLKKPFTFTYYNNSFLVILILVYYFREKIKECVYKKNNSNENEQEADIDLIRESTMEENFSDAYQKIKKDKRQEFEEFSNHIVILLMVFWYFSNAFYNFGLSVLNGPYGNSMSYMSFVFVYLERLCCFGRKCSVIKVFSVFLAIGGLSLLIINQYTQAYTFTSEWYYGYMFVMIGSFFFATFTMLISFFSKRYGDDFDVVLIFGFMGLYNLLLVPIFLFILSIFGGEMFIFPGFDGLGEIILNSSFQTLVGDLLMSFSVIQLSPQLVSMGLTLTIPFSIIFEYMIGSEASAEVNFDFYFFSGMIILFLSMLIVVYESYKKKLLKCQKATAGKTGEQFSMQSQSPFVQ